MNIVVLESKANNQPGECVLRICPKSSHSWYLEKLTNEAEQPCMLHSKSVAWKYHRKSQSLSDVTAIYEEIKKLLILVEIFLLKCWSCVRRCRLADAVAATANRIPSFSALTWWWIKSGKFSKAFVSASKHFFLVCGIHFWPLYGLLS